MRKKILIGSKYFFSSYKDYKSKDTDWLIIEDNPVYYKNTMTIRGRGEDLMFFKLRTKEEFIKQCLNSNLALTVGKFLIPEFNEFINFTIEDLSKIKPQIEKLDNKHLYEKYIYEYYLENKEFNLNENQLNKAYEIYKQYK